VKKINKIERLMNIIIILKIRTGKTPSESSLSSYMDKSWLHYLLCQSAYPKKPTPGNAKINCWNEVRI